LFLTAEDAAHIGQLEQAYRATNDRNIQQSHLSARCLKENHMAEDIKKDQGQNPGQSGQPQQKQDDPSKKNPTQDTNQQDDKQKQQDQGGQRRAS
jgi:hypothetical protein